MVEDVYEPLDLWRRELRDAHRKNVAERFEALVAESGVDEEENKRLVAEVRKLEKDLAKEKARLESRTVLRNLALALANAKDKEDDFVKGVRLVYDTFLKTLKDHGAEPFDSVGKELDTETMEAIAHLPSAEVGEGKVSIESRRGWMLKGKVLRAAQVVVSSGKPPEGK